MQHISQFINQVTCGDCVRVLPELPAGSIDFVLTDPPYLVRYRDRQGRTIANHGRSDWPEARICSNLPRAEARQLLQQLLRPGVCRTLLSNRPPGLGQAVCSSERFVRYCHEQAYLLAKGILSSS